jgi:glycine dehydrogenase subunit 1
MRYLPLTPADRAAMLARIGVDNIDALFSDVPADALQSGPIAGLPAHASEMAVERHMGRLSAENLSAGAAPFFLGAGAYKHHIPASVDHLIQRGEFLTAYTPYQPEIAQGTLQVLFEFQTQVARLLGTDIANASLYDGSTACWEAIAMAHRVTKRKKSILTGGLHPHYVATAQTMARFTDDVLVAQAPVLSADAEDAAIIAAIDGETSAVVVQYPDILGRIPDLAAISSAAQAKGALLIVVVTEPVALGLLEAPGRWAPTSSWVRGSRWASACNLAGRIWACSVAAKSSCARSPGRFAAKRWMPKAPQLRADAFHARTAHPPRKGDQQHLHQFRPVRAGFQHSHEPAGRRWSGTSGPHQPWQGAGSGGRFGGGSGRVGPERCLFQRVHGDPAQGCAKWLMLWRQGHSGRCAFGPPLCRQRWPMACC